VHSQKYGPIDDRSFAKHCTTIAHIKAPATRLAGLREAFMFDEVAHPRDYIDKNVIISRAGGGLVKDNVSSEMRAGRDQAEDSVSQGQRTCMIHNNPVVILTGVGNPHVPSNHHISTVYWTTSNLHTFGLRRAATARLCDTASRSSTRRRSPGGNRKMRMTRSSLAHCHR
jgi:hypothetical protein